MAEKEYIGREANCRNCFHLCACVRSVSRVLRDCTEEEVAIEFYKDGVCDNFKPTADVVEVVHGEWIDKPTGRYCHIGSYCSVCGKKSGIGGIESNRHKPYCPNCGAKMYGKDGADNEPQ